MGNLILAISMLLISISNGQSFKHTFCLDLFLVSTFLGSAVNHIPEH